MTPLLFGPDHRRLFGVYHAAASGTRGVVLIPPLGQEALRAHRALRILADALAQSGWHVLRFDPYGTGDSGGDDEDVTLAGVVSDVAVATLELQAVTGARQMALGGLRFGATAALLAAPTLPSVRALLLWEPVVYGAQLAAELDLSASKVTESQGFRYAAGLCGELQGVTPERLARGPLPKRGLLVWSVAPERAFTETLARAIERLEVATLPAPAAWSEENDFGAGPVPAGVIARFAEWRP